MKLTINIIAISISLFILNGCGQPSEKKDELLTQDQIVDITTQAYVYGYPLILMEYAKRSITYISEPNIKGNVPVNQLHHLRTFPDHTFTEVVKPNVDTYYSLA